MEIDTNNKTERRICLICGRSLGEKIHGNRKYHPECEYENKKQRQKKRYQIGNAAKLQIQKNEVVASRLYEMDKQKNGIPFTYAMEQGFRFDCPTLTRKHLNKTVNMFDHYGYVLETIKGEILIFIYHDAKTGYLDHI